MIPEQDLEKIRIYLEKAEDPLFFFDDDNDGMCSFILLRQFAGKGRGIPIKSSPEVEGKFVRKVEEINPDIVFVLDKPKISQEFIDRIKVPIVWIDHHPIEKRDGVYYFNPKLKNKDDVSSTTYWAYKAVGGKLWIATIGAVSDWTIPDYFDEFKKKYPKLTGNKKTAPDLLFDSKLGELCKIFSFLTKGSTSDIRKNISAILKIEKPEEILEKTTSKGKFIFKQAEKIKKDYDSLLERALKVKDDKGVIVFKYSTNENSMTSELSNELLYKRPGKVIIIAREKDDDMRMSLRGDILEVRPMLEKALKNVDGYGGGHAHACGANVKKVDFNKFIDIIKKEVSQKR